MLEFFNTELLMKAMKPIGYWTRFKLLFRPTNYSKDSVYTVKFKELNGVVYILEYTES